MVRGRLPTANPPSHRWSRPRYSARGRLLGPVHTWSEAPRAPLAMLQAKAERRQGPHILQVNRPLAPLAAKGGARPRGGTLITRPRPEYSCRQGSTPVSFQTTAHVTAVVALHVCYDPHRGFPANLGLLLPALTMGPLSQSSSAHRSHYVIRWRACCGWARRMKKEAAPSGAASGLPIGGVC
jgi:hypothetical protein